MDQHLATRVPIEVSFQSGIEAYRLGAFTRSEHCFTAVLDDFPGYAPALINRALARWSRGALDDAEQDAAEACAAAPDSSEAWMVAGAIRIDRRDAAGAIAAYHRAVSLHPDRATTHAGLAAAHLAAAHHNEAQQTAALALALDPTCHHARFTLGSARAALGDAAGAIRQFDRVIAAEPAHAGAHLNRGNARINLDDIAGGEADLRQAVAHNPSLKEAWASLGVVRTIAGDIADAIAACDRAIALDPDFAVAQWNRGVACLLGGDFAAGFEAYEWRKRHPIYGPHFDRLPAPTWRGESLTGKHLLVRAEQGLGDTIMFARFLPDLARQASQLTLACHPTLFGLFAHLDIGMIGLNDRAPHDVDVAIDQMSLPHVLTLTAETIPAAQGYLTPPPHVTRPWHAMLDRPAGHRAIGLVWAGNPDHNNDQRRSLPPGTLTPLLDVPDTRFVSLQLGTRGGEYPIPDLAPLITDFASTAELVASLDAVVTVDTSIAHLAGAMGKTCHILLSASCDWRWLLGRNTTPWYDSIRLHRQTRLGDWSPPIASVRGALARPQARPRGSAPWTPAGALGPRPR